MMMRKLLISAIALGILCACSGASAMTPPGTSTDICNGEPPIPEFTLTSPAAGATNVSDSTSALVFTGSLFTRVGQPSITLATSAGATQTLTTFNATSNGYSVPLPALSAGTTYTVTYVVQTLPAAQSSSACPSQESVNEGSFTTQ
jgi:hypothetical protein